MATPTPIYVDNNATTRVDPEVFDAMRPFFCERYGNPSSIHTFGGGVGKALDEARARVAALLGCIETEIVFTSCGTEGNNAAIHAACQAAPKKHHVVTTAVEHPAVLTPAKSLVRNGYEVTFLPVNGEGHIDASAVAAALRDDTALVSAMWANNETGVVFPVEKIGEAARARGVLFHVDGVQAVGKIPFRLDDLPIDMLTLSGHKLHAPKGVGALYVRRGVRFRGVLQGGHQERGRRAGTENVAGIVGLGKACELGAQRIEEEETRVRVLRDRLEVGILAALPDTLRNGSEPRLPNTANLSFPYVEGEAILLLLDREGICASSGSACTSGSLEPSHVLKAMGIPFAAAHGSVRFSLSRENTDAEVDRILEVLPGIIRHLRNLSPFGKRKDRAEAAP